MEYLCIADITHDRTPNGPKHNVYCLVRNECNIERRARGQRSVFDDDCGVWTSTSSTTKYPYLVTEGSNFKRLFLRNGLYCNEQLRGKVRTYVPMEPQPTAERLLCIYRYYAKQTRDASTGLSDFRKRVSWIEGGIIALIEYLGQSNPVAPHGNNTVSSEPYIRTPHATMELIKAQVKVQSGKVVYDQLVDKLDNDDAPRNSRVVNNKRYNENSQTRKKLAKDYRLNFADEVLAICSSVANDDFIRLVSLSSNRVPSIILYSDRQLSDIKAMCFDKHTGSVLSVDKTYNLGQLYVTVTVYRNLALQRAGTHDVPIFIGPLFIHGNSDFETYAHFFSHISARLAGCNFRELRIGSDEETAMRKAITHCFNGVQLVACTRHLRENVRRSGQKIAAVNDQNINSLIRLVFGVGGLTSCHDAITYEEALRLLQTGVMSVVPAALQTYFNDKVEPMLRQNMQAGCSNWTNNACESINHVLKQRLQWRRSMLPDLCENLRLLVNSQFKEADRAICGRGDYILRSDYQQHRQTLEVWRAMSERQRKRVRDATFVLPTEAKTGQRQCTSTDGNLRVLYKPNAGKKLNQQKRHRAARTTTLSKRPKL